MTEIVMPQVESAGSMVQSRGKAVKRFASGDNFFRRLTQGAALVVLLILGGAIISLIQGSIPAFRAFGFGFFTTEIWNPVTEKFGAGAAIFGTLVTSAIAMAIAVPVGIGIAIFLTELCPPVSAPTDRHRHRAAGRNSEHHLRHLGLVRVRPVHAAIRSARR